MKPLAVWFDSDKGRFVAWSPHDFPEVPAGYGRTETLAVATFTVNLCNRASLLLQLADERTYVITDSEGNVL